VSKNARAVSNPATDAGSAATVSRSATNGTRSPTPAGGIGSTVSGHCDKTAGNNKTASAAVDHNVRRLQEHVMSTSPEETIRPRFLENSLLVVAGMFAHAPLYYQLPRWANGLDPTFVHQRWIAQSPFPVLLHMAAVHPLVWIALMVVIFVRLCRNYGWRLST